MQMLKEVIYDGLVRTNEKVYDLLCLGRSMQQSIEGDTKSFPLHYIDWTNWQNNVFHVTEEFSVERTGSHETRRPDIVLFVNGIPLAVIECKRPDLKDAIEEAISQHLRNQREDEIPRLFLYAQHSRQSRKMRPSTRLWARQNSGLHGKNWAITR